MPKPPGRLDARLFSVCHEIELPNDVSVIHRFEIQVGLNEGGITEIAFASRGKVGQGFDLLLLDVGLWVSRILQGRDPETGEEMDLYG